MTDHPILFSTPMVRALLAGTKTQTRRLAWREAQTGGFQRTYGDRVENRHAVPSAAARIKPGDRLWVREGWHTWRSNEDRPPRDIPMDSLIEYLTDRERFTSGKARAAIHLPRWASRLTLEVTGTRIEQLQDISEADALAEGVVPHESGGFHVHGIEHWNKDFPYLSRTTAREMYAALWDTINGSGAWLANLEVVVMQFKVHLCNIDRMPTDG